MNEIDNVGLFSDMGAPSAPGVAIAAAGPSPAQRAAAGPMPYSELATQIRDLLDK